MFVQIGELSTSGVSAFGSLLGKLFLVEIESECRSCSEASQFSSGYVILISIHA